MTTQLKSLGIDFNFFEATDLKDAETDPMFNLYSRDQFQRANPVYHQRKGHLTRGEIACTLSHYRVAKRIATDNIPWAIVLEDDTLIRAQNLISLAESAIQYARDQEVILLNSWCQGVHLPSAQKIAGFPYTLHRPNRQTVLAGGVIWSLAAAIAITSDIERNGVRRMFDWWIHKRNSDWKGIIHVSVIKPDPIIQSEALPSIISAAGRAGGDGSRYGDQDPWFGLFKGVTWKWEKPHRWPRYLQRMLSKVASSFLRPPPEVRQEYRVVIDPAAKRDAHRRPLEWVNPGDSSQAAGFPKRESQR